MARFLEGRAGVGVVGIRTLEVEADAVDRHLSDVLAVGSIDDEAFGSIVAMYLLLVVVIDQVVHNEMAVQSHHLAMYPPFALIDRREWERGDWLSIPESKSDWKGAEDAVRSDGESGWIAITPIVSHIARDVAHGWVANPSFQRLFHPHPRRSYRSAALDKTGVRSARSFLAGRPCSCRRVYLGWNHQLRTAYQVGAAGAREVSGSYEATGYRGMHQSYHLAGVSLSITPISDGGHTTI